MHRLEAMSDKARLDLLRHMPCIVTANRPAEPHHLIAMGDGKMGSKADDSQTIPLCRKMHNLLHHDVRAFEAEYGTQQELLKKTELWINI